MSVVIRIVADCLLSALLSLCSLEQGLSSNGVVHPVHSVIVKKPIGLQRNDATAVVPVIELVGYNNDEVARLMVLFSDQEVASQACDVNDDGIIDELLFVGSFGANTNREFTLKLGLSLINNRNYPKSTHAELSKRFGGIKTAQAFLEHLDKTIKRLEFPLEITVAATSHQLISHLVFSNLWSIK